MTAATAGFLRSITMGCVCGKDTLSIQNNRYTVLERLGEGGFSVIDLVRDAQTRRLHALKRITCHSQKDENDALQEAEYMNLVQHRNLVPCVANGVREIKKHGSIMSEVLIVMPYYRKGSLFDEIEELRCRSARMLETRVVSLLIGICEGLHALHSLSPLPLAHRDVKPHNVMLEANVDNVNEDIPVLMDFGSMGPARHEITSMAQATTLQDLAAEKCTMPYRAPELFHVDSRCIIDERVDIWSLGCTLYAMCFYESPFDKVHQRGDSIALAAMAGNIKLPDSNLYSQELMTLMLCMLSVTPCDRPTANQIIASLHHITSQNTASLKTSVQHSDELSQSLLAAPVTTNIPSSQAVRGSRELGHNI